MAKAKAEKEKQVEPDIEVSKDRVVITVPIQSPIRPSKSGKSLTIATTHGGITTKALVNGKVVWMNVNVYVKHSG
jgi:hypothetical protein